MRKITLALALAIVAAAAFAAPSAQAQTTYPSVSGLTPFSPECNYMSKAGFLRYTYFRTSGNLISYEEAYQQVQAQGG